MKFTSNIKFIVLISTILVAITSILFFYVLNQHKPTSTQVNDVNLECGTVTTANTPVLANGKKMFNMYCAACHKMHADFVGPKLRGVQDRAKMDIYTFVTNERKLLRDKNAYAIQLNHDWIEISFDHSFELTKEEVDAILSYTSIYN